MDQQRETFDFFSSSFNNERTTASSSNHDLIQFDEVDKINEYTVVKKERIRQRYKNQTPLTSVAPSAAPFNVSVDYTKPSEKIGDLKKLHGGTSRYGVWNSLSQNFTMASDNCRSNDHGIALSKDDRGYGTAREHDVFSYTSLPGIHGVLEIEEERSIPANRSLSDIMALDDEPVRTSSGLILTHRRDQDYTPQDFEIFESGTETPKLFSFVYPLQAKLDSMGPLRNKLSMTRNEDAYRKRWIWMKLCFSGCFVLVIAILGMKCIHIQNNQSTELLTEFEEWITHHKKTYKTHEEKQKRFQIWMDNHHRTLSKNEKHGPCKLTNNAVFGSNHFKDLTTEEFQSKFLTGYRPPGGKGGGMTSDEFVRVNGIRLDHLEKLKVKLQKNEEVEIGRLGRRRSTGDTYEESHIIEAPIVEHWKVEDGEYRMQQKDPTMTKKYIEHWSSDNVEWTTKHEDEIPKSTLDQPEDLDTDPTMTKRYIKHWSPDNVEWTTKHEDEIPKSTLDQPDDLDTDPTMTKRYIKHWSPDNVEWTTKHEDEIPRSSLEQPDDLDTDPIMGKKYIEHWTPSSNAGKYKRKHIEKWTPSSYWKYKIKQRNQINNNQKKYYSSTGGRRLEGFTPKMNTVTFENKNPFTTCGYSNWSCWLQWLFDSYPYYGGNMEPRYDSSAYPTSLDWRELGAVTSIHSQGQCGACWAIAAVETIESALYLKSGQLLDLAEEEVILCDDSCEMCYGGWPQNAFDYVKNRGGLPLETNMSFDDSLLLAITLCKAGEADYFSEDAIKNYLGQVCPANGGESTARYGAIRGYGYTTDRCICYTNGSGCNCDDQDEEKAIQNVASYGPAVVCLDASTWQDYQGGIMTAESGCSSEFLAMNHCVQVVGYAFTDQDKNDGEPYNRKLPEDSGDSRDRAGGGGREGYWIVRNQWSKYWGMNGYAYVAMGGENTNTCGILNDMTQAFM